MNDNDGTEYGNEKTSATEARQTLFALAIAKGESVRTASQAANVSESTGYRWSADRRVGGLANRYRKRIVRETVGKIVEMGAKATERLSLLMDSPDDAISLKASLAVLAEVRRIADATDGDIYRQSLPVPPVETPDKMEIMLDWHAERWDREDKKTDPLAFLAAAEMDAKTASMNDNLVAKLHRTSRRVAPAGGPTGDRVTYSAIPVGPARSDE